MSERSCAEPAGGNATVVHPADGTVPCLWPGSTIVCIGSGPSLTPADVSHCQRAAAHLLVVNDAYRLVPGADALYAADEIWWRWQKDVPDQQLPPWLFTIDQFARPWRPSVTVLNYRTGIGVGVNPYEVYTGGHSGYQAIQVAAHLGAARIILLGYDLQPGPAGEHHFFGEHPNGNHLNYAARRSAYDTLTADLARLGIVLVNATRRTALTSIPRAPLADLLPLTPL